MQVYAMDTSLTRRQFLAHQSIAIELLADAKKGDLWTLYLIRRQEHWAALSGAFGCGADL